MIDDVRDLFAYNRWANGRTFEHTGSLSREELARDLGSSFPSVRDTLAHMIGSEWIWLRRWKGASPSGFPGDRDLSTHEALVAFWREVDAEREAWLDGLDDDDLNATLAYRNTKGEPFEGRLVDLLRHVVNHGSYHRGQLVTMLRQLGAEPAGTDLVLYHRERKR